MTDIRVSQAVGEAVEQEPVDVRVSQAVLEATSQEPVDVWLSQVVKEVVHTFECPDDEPSTPTVIPTTSSTENIRRQRRTPHLSEEEVWLLYTYFQLDCEVGVGLDGGAAVQGSDPQLMLRWSDDGGHVWSSEHWVSAGKLGEYKWRAIWRRLGRSRNRMFEVTVTDPVRWTWIEAYLGIRRGRR